MVSSKPSRFGIDVVGDIDWGTHLCQFYKTKEDLIDVLVPYFAEGLRRKEFCMWVTSPPLEVKEAWEALRKAVPNLDQYVRNRQIEIISYDDWYLKGGSFDADRVLHGWVEKERDALSRDFEGLRLTGNTFWIERANWESFVDYEAKVNAVIGQHRMIALCTYSLEKCSGKDVVDVIKNHVGSLIRKDKAWYLVEDVAERRIVEKEASRLASFPMLNPNPVVEADYEANVTYSNQATSIIFPDLGKLGSLHPFFSDWKQVIETFQDGNIRTFNRQIKIGEHWFFHQIYHVPENQRVRIYAVNIEELKQAETTLIESEKRLKKSQEIAHLGSWELDVVNNRLSWSDEVYRIFGLQPQEFGATYEAFLEAAHPDDRAAVDAAYSSSLREGKDSYEIEHRIVRRSTCEIRFVHEKCEHFRDESGRIVRSVGMVQDITERKKAEAEEIRQNKLLQGIKRIFQEVLSARTEEALGRICLSVAEQITQSNFGFIGEINEKGLQDIAISNPGWEACRMADQSGHLNPPGNFKIHGIYGRVLTDSRGFYTNDPANHPDAVGLPPGHPPLKAFLGVPMTHEGRTIGMIAVGKREGGYTQDDLKSLEGLAPAVVEALLRKRAEDALRENEQRWAATLASIGDAVIATDAEERVTFMNGVAEELTGWTLGEALQTPLGEVFKIINEFTRLEAENPVAKVLEKGAIVDLANHSILVRKDGAEVPIDDSGAPIRDKDGMTKGVVIVFRDITERKKLEAKNEEYAKHLEELVEERTRKLRDSERLAAIGATAGMVGHDLRNPLQSVEGAVYLAKEELKSLPSESPLRTSLQETLEIIEAQTDYMDKIVSDLQDFVKPITPQVDEVDIQKLVDRTLSAITFPDNIEVETLLEEDFDKITVDPLLMMRVFNNLIVNAVQAMPRGGRLTLKSRREGSAVLFSVSDTGVGIPEDVKAKLFTPLFTTKSKGQGFGLVVCKRIVEAQNGAITFESELGKGTTFTVRIPSTK